MPVPAAPSPWQAVRFEQVMDAGRTKPLLLDCERREGDRRMRARFVTKTNGLPEVYAESLACEWLGGRLASMCGLAAPRTEVVILSADFISAARDELDSAGVRPLPGLGVGSEFETGLIPFPLPAELAPAEVNEAAAVYAFDLLVQNPDRSGSKPNCGRAAGRIVPFDFETCFSFRLALDRREPWLVASLPMARRHLFYTALSQHPVDWHRVLEPFQQVGSEAVADLCSSIRSEWADVAFDVRHHLDAVLAHWPQFEREVIRSLREGP